MKGQNWERHRLIRQKTEEMLGARPWRTALCLEIGEDWALDTVKPEQVQKISVFGRREEVLERCQKRFGAFLGEKLYLKKLDWNGAKEFSEAEAVFADLTKEAVNAASLAETIERTKAVFASFLVGDEGEIIMEMQAKGMDLSCYRDYDLGNNKILRLDFQKVF